MIKQALEYIAKQLVENPEHIKVQVIHDGARSTVQMHIAADDFKRIIGKDGSVVRSLREVAYALEPSTDKTIQIEVIKQ